MVTREKGERGEGGCSCWGSSKMQNGGDREKQGRGQRQQAGGSAAAVDCRRPDRASAFAAVAVIIGGGVQQPAAAAAARSACSLHTRERAPPCAHLLAVLTTWQGSSALFPVVRFAQLVLCAWGHQHSESRLLTAFAHCEQQRSEWQYRLGAHAVMRRASCGLRAPLLAFLIPRSQCRLKQRVADQIATKCRKRQRFTCIPPPPPQRAVSSLCPSQILEAGFMASARHSMSSSMRAAR